MAALLGLGAWRAWRRTPEAHPPRPASRVEVLLVAGVTLGWLVQVLRIPAWDQPFGTDWMVYLENAVAFAREDWSAWHPWRAPGHAVASLGLVPLAGGLVEAAQLVAALSTAAILPCAWGLARREGGAFAGLAAIGLLAAWPDLWVFGRTTSPYPLLAGLYAGALAAAGARGRATAVLAGVLFAAAGLTDQRGGPLAAIALGGALLAAAVDRDPVRAARVGGITLVFGGLSALGWALFPVDLLPLTEQVGLQRDLHAREGLAHLCRPTGGRLPGPAEWLDGCARATLLGNLSRAQAVAPVALAFAGALLLLGGRRGLAQWGLPLLSLLPAAWWIGLEHRYLLPLAAPAAALAGLGLAWIRARAGVPIAAALLLTLGVGLVQDGGSLWARSQGAERGRQVATAAVLGAETPMVQLRRVLRAEVGEGDRVVDCAQAGLPARLYPIAAEEVGGGGGGRLSGRCRRMVTGPPPEGTRWVLAVLPPEVVPAEGWIRRFSAPRGPAQLVLLRAGP